MDKCPVKRISVKFYCLASGKEPVLEWLKMLSKSDKRIVGFDIKTVEEGWPLGACTRIEVVAKITERL